MQLTDHCKEIPITANTGRIKDGHFSVYYISAKGYNLIGKCLMVLKGSSCTLFFKLTCNVSLNVVVSFYITFSQAGFAALL